MEIFGIFVAVVITAGLGYFIYTRVKKTNAGSGPGGNSKYPNKNRQ